MPGSISAEHGIGTLKRDELAATKQPVEMAMMRGVKQLLDPQQHPQPGQGIVMASVEFRPVEDAEVESVIALWETCGLTRPWKRSGQGHRVCPVRTGVRPAGDERQ